MDQTVNLTSSTSVVRIHLCPPKPETFFENKCVSGFSIENIAKKGEKNRRISEISRKNADFVFFLKNFFALKYYGTQICLFCR